MLAPFEFGQHAPVFNHLRAVSDKIPEVRGERGWGCGEGRGGAGRGATTRSLFSHPADGCMVSRLGVASRHKKPSWLLDLPLQRLGRNHAFTHSLGYNGESGADSDSILSTAESRGRTARVYSVQRRVGGGQREYTRSQNPSYTPQTQNNNICLWLQARSSVVTKWVADRYVLGFAPAPRASTLRASFSGTFLQEGCRKPVLGVCPKSSPEQQ